MPDGKLLVQHNILYYNNSKVLLYNDNNILKGTLLTAVTQDVQVDTNTLFYIPQNLNIYNKIFIRIVFNYNTQSTTTNYYYSLYIDDKEAVYRGLITPSGEVYLSLMQNLYNNVYTNALDDMNKNYISIKITTSLSAPTQQIRCEIGNFA